MSEWKRLRLPCAARLIGGGRQVFTLGLAMALVAGLLALLPQTASTGTDPREIVMVARDMAFYLAGGSEPNPRIRLTAGEEVRFNFSNLDYGFKHNLVIDGLGIETAYLEADESTIISVRAPKQVGHQPYICFPHREMMQGMIEVVARD